MNIIYNFEHKIKFLGSELAQETNSFIPKVGDLVAVNKIKTWRIIAIKNNSALVIGLPGTDAQGKIMYAYWQELTYIK